MKYPRIQGLYASSRYVSNHKLSAFTHLLILTLLLASFFFPVQPVLGQNDASPTPGATTTPAPSANLSEQALALLEQMTPEERVGQLFLVTFNGATAEPGSEIDELISAYHVGGVVLAAANDNFSDQDDILQNVISLTNQLQGIGYEASQISQTNPDTQENFTPVYIPLFIGISQEGDGYPYDQIRNGITPLPNSMAIGATWSPDLARQVGNVLGQELSALGINFLLGPSLDILDTPHTETVLDLGTRTFGGDPFWVGKLGQAYIEGVHQGSNGRVAVVAKHFPGYGGSDRLPEDEVATVRKSLDQLINFELEPFFDVTAQAPNSAATADGLLTSHIRYQGFQGNIRATTRPVSFDPQALRLLLSLPEFDQWRSTGGLMVSDNLGGKAVRGFYDLTSQTFDMPRRVALNAFLAGNDLLYIADFSSDELDSFSAAKRTLEFFAQKYRDDPAFASRVDESVLRILTLKQRIYQEFSPDQTLVSENPADTMGVNNQVTFDVARQAATLISPSQAELDENIPDPPNQNDRIAFVTDTRTSQQCSQCDPVPLIAENAIEQSVLRLYGPQGGGQVTAANMISYTLADLSEMLDNPRGDLPIERSLQRANWIVFSMLDYSARVPSYQTLSQFLAERPDLFQQKRLIVFSFNAPYYLDATNISKLTAYYGLYSKAPQFVDMAAYLLFQEIRAAGNSPVSIPAISYNLSTALSPDPELTIPLDLDLPPQEPGQETGTPEPPPQPVFRIGDLVPLRAGPIFDNNGNSVPDGTPVEFTFSMNGQSNPSRQVAFTSEGLARTTYTIAEGGSLEIQASSDQALSSIFRIDIPNPIGEEGVTPTATPTLEPTPTPSPTPPPPAMPVTSAPTPTNPTLGDWIMSLVLLSSLAWLVYKYISNTANPGWGVRTGLLVLICGLIAYSLLLLRLPGTEFLQEMSISRAVLFASLFGGVIGIVISGSWRLIQQGSKK